jgi:hypothetical protein
VRVKLPLQKSSFSPAMAPEKVLIAIDGSVTNEVIEEVNDQPIGKPQE